MNAVAYAQLVDRLVAEDGPDNPTTDLLLAAADGPEQLAAYLGGAPAPAPRPIPDEEPSPSPSLVFLEEVAVEGFRGVGPRARLPLEAAPGLTLVVGRNGSGKSSFAEGLELLLTGQNLRWEGKTRVWKEGWHNLHTDGPATLTARFRLDGEAKPLVVRRSWAAGEELDTGGTLSITGSVTAWEELGWDGPLQRFRPILSYNELGAMFSSRAAELYDALSAVLGLEPFEQLSALLAQARLEREKTAKREKAEREELRALLADSDDERAVAAVAALAKATPDLDAVQQILIGDGADDSELPADQALAALAVPSVEAVTSAFADLMEAEEEVARLATTDVQRTAAVASLLEQALALHEHHGDGPCPVCGVGALDATWSLQAQSSVQELQRQAADLRAAHHTLVECRHAVERLFPPSAASHVDPDLWTARTESAKGAEAVRAAVGEAVAGARAELERREAGWRPLEQRIDAWVVTFEQAATDKVHVKAIKAAEAWLKALIVDLRRERLAPIVDAAQANWERLRHESNVELGEVGLKVAGKQRSVVFDVKVDGTATSAYGVMSQGELSALAISVFLPRASLPQSPFGFMVIDDPVQSMDPAKVDGLARVLAAAAEHRQVVVFTHDDRLPQAVDRLGIDARTVRVQRRAESKVEVVAGAPPSDRYIGEALALAKSEDLTPQVRRRVVPVFCRSAIEAACATRIRRRLAAAGVSQAEADERLAANDTTRKWLADAFELSLAQGKELEQRVRQVAGDDAWTVVQVAVKGAHADQQRDPHAQAKATRKLVKALEA